MGTLSRVIAAWSLREQQWRAAAGVRACDEPPLESFDAVYLRVCVLVSASIVLTCIVCLTPVAPNANIPAGVWEAKAALQAVEAQRMALDLERTRACACRSCTCCADCSVASVSCIAWCMCVLPFLQPSPLLSWPPGDRRRKVSGCHTAVVVSSSVSPNPSHLSLSLSFFLSVCHSISVSLPPLSSPLSLLQTLPLSSPLSFSLPLSLFSVFHSPHARLHSHEGVVHPAEGGPGQRRKGGKSD